LAQGFRLPAILGAPDRSRSQTVAARDELVQFLSENLFPNILAPQL
jgi:hypothetical protein